ncbi:very short patch repair endonuclease [Burkholderia oklahomensis]|uniref:very short patch repair endonuclease n=1 Tax=Burkholderia oklahomensis TaxID=342113 RepID=UPI00016A978D|nr:very short patch repair endonuclease [Burkholderia oklahomensis]AOI44476.1 very short patch repair endonuclease [Burkholderia oklahomensis C6786]KUY61512.1 very short patch repair endonuclease [Burkholderia oklahomensis C6786]MBI0359526.1 DNA mismatch endonuclease Vsr [Burkholderia oklahomensis]
MKEAPEQRSRIMRAVRSRDTQPELAVRRLLRSLGFPGYRLHRPDLPGKPDIAFIGRRKAIFIHGCFWHGHNCPRGNRIPVANADYWCRKIERNRQRDSKHLTELYSLGWLVLTIWECQLRDVAAISARLANFMTEGDASRGPFKGDGEMSKE